MSPLADSRLERHDLDNTLSPLSQAVQLVHSTAQA